MKRRDFLKLLGIGIAVPTAVVKAVNSIPETIRPTKGIVPHIRGLDINSIRPTTAIIDDFETFGKGHTTMRGVLAEEEFKNRRMSKLLEYQREREIAFFTGTKWSDADLKIISNI